MRRPIGFLLLSILLLALYGCGGGLPLPSQKPVGQPTAGEMPTSPPKPTAGPVEPTAEPVEPTTEMVEPTAEPIEPTSEPTEKPPLVSGLNPEPPDETMRLIFIHHSSGENWLNDALRAQLNANNYFVVDTNYGWGPSDADLGYDTIGDHTDIGHWYNWFAGPHRDTYMAEVFSDGWGGEYNSGVSDPGGENTIVMFKSCFPNSALGGNPDDPPAGDDNPLRGQDAGSEYHTVANAKGIYNDILPFFAEHPDKLFVVITAPPLVEVYADPVQAANARALNRWLVEEWLADYPYDNVLVFDFYNVLTSNGGDPETNDLDWDSGNHHRFRDGVIEYITDQGHDYSAYGQGEDSHPNWAGNEKAAAEFVPLLNIAVHCWLGDGECP